MDAQTIDKLASLDPDAPMPGVSVFTSQDEVREWSPVMEIALENFLSRYSKPNFGYYIASQFAKHRMAFPLALYGRDMWVFRAYLMRLDPWGNFDPFVAEAYQLAQQIEGAAPSMGLQLKALLLSMGPEFETTEKHINYVHKKTGISVPTIDAFEVLFFNVIDRRLEASYISQIVYPQTRMKEYDEDYYNSSTVGELLQRVAHNHGNMDMTAYLAGLGDQSFLQKLAASDDRESELTKYLMGNGLIMAHSNLLNHRSVGMNRASNLLAASRQGGQDQEEPTIGGIAPLFSEAYQEAVDVSFEVVKEQMKIDSGIDDARKAQRIEEEAMPATE